MINNIEQRKQSLPPEIPDRRKLESIICSYFPWAQDDEETENGSNSVSDEFVDEEMGPYEQLAARLVYGLISESELDELMGNEWNDSDQSSNEEEENGPGEMREKDETYSEDEEWEAYFAEYGNGREWEPNEIKESTVIERIETNKN